jgi:diphthamide synthase subunit DPH2
MAKMQLHFIPVRYKKEVVLPGELVENLPKRLILFTTIQYHNQLDNWKRVLEEAGKEVHTFRPKHSVAEGHLLGAGLRSGTWMQMPSCMWATGCFIKSIGDQQ